MAGELLDTGNSNERRSRYKTERKVKEVEIAIEEIMGGTANLRG